MSDDIRRLIDEAKKAAGGMGDAAKNSMRARATGHYAFSVPVDTQSERYSKIRQASLALSELLIEVCPVSFELSNAMDKLREVAFWAMESITRNEFDADRQKAMMDHARAMQERADGKATFE